MENGRLSFGGQFMTNLKKTEKIRWASLSLLPPTLLNSPASAHGHPVLPSLRGKRRLPACTLECVPAGLCSTPKLQLMKDTNTTVPTSDNMHKCLPSQKRKRPIKFSCGSSPCLAAAHLLFPSRQLLSYFNPTLTPSQPALDLPP